jgi:hypothetical protein
MMKTFPQELRGKFFILDDEDQYRSEATHLFVISRVPSLTD